MISTSLKSSDVWSRLNPYVRDMIIAKAEQLIQLCKQHRVLSLEVIGSATNDRFDPLNSDLDFLVEFINQNPEGASTRFFGLRKGLAELFNKTVDLIEVNEIQNPYFLEAIASTRVMIYGA